jgi:predicted XRE-type DNA-binding protein
MAKSKKYPAQSAAHVRWPNEKELAEIRERLSSNEVLGSTVLGPDASVVDRIKQDLCSKIVQYHLATGTSQQELALKLGVDEPEMSRILHYKIERYSIDRLVGYLAVLYPNVKLEVSAA